MAISHRAGEFFALSEGEYSDYSFNGLYRALVDIDMAQAAEEFIPHLKARALLEGKEIPDWVEEKEIPGHLHPGAGSSSFGAYLMRLGLAEPIDYDEIHVGSYGDIHVEEIQGHATRRAFEKLKQQIDAEHAHRRQV